MTLFDRKVDLARFSETTPLYVMCRDWMRNKPQRRQPQINTPAAIAEVPPPSLSLPFSLLHSPKVVGCIRNVPKLMQNYPMVLVPYKKEPQATKSWCGIAPSCRDALYCGSSLIHNFRVLRKKVSIFFLDQHNDIQPPKVCNLEYSVFKKIFPLHFFFTGN